VQVNATIFPLKFFGQQNSTVASTSSPVGQKQLAGFVFLPTSSSLAGVFILANRNNQIFKILSQ
jgi:hypothetical protein